MQLPDSLNSKAYFLMIYNNSRSILYAYCQNFVFALVDNVELTIDETETTHLHVTIDELNIYLIAFDMFVFPLCMNPPVTILFSNYSLSLLQKNVE